MLFDIGILFGDNFRSNLSDFCHQSSFKRLTGRILRQIININLKLFRQFKSFGGELLFRPFTKLIIDHRSFCHFTLLVAGHALYLFWRNSGRKSDVHPRLRGGVLLRELL